MQYNLIKQMLSAALLILGLHNTAFAAGLPGDRCSLATLAGKYIWEENSITVIEGMSPFYGASVGKEVNDGNGNITAGEFTVNSSFTSAAGVFTYTGTVTVEPNCVGTYLITLDGGEVGSGGGGTIYVDPVSGNFTLLDKFNVGIARFRKDGSDGGLNSPFPEINWP